MKKKTAAYVNLPREVTSAATDVLRPETMLVKVETAGTGAGAERT